MIFGTSLLGKENMNDVLDIIQHLHNVTLKYIYVWCIISTEERNLSLLNAAGGKNKQEPRSQHSSSNDCKLWPLTLTYDLREFQREFAYPGHLFRNLQVDHAIQYSQKQNWNDNNHNRRVSRQCADRYHLVLKLLSMYKHWTEFSAQIHRSG